MRHEVVIAGAGPGGVATAVAILRADPSLRGRVLLCDRARFPRPKPCGGGLTGHVDEALAALGLELTVPSFPSPRAIVRYGAMAREVGLARPVNVVRREEFDASLVAQARDLGAEVRESTAITDFTVEEGCVRVALPSGAIETRILVGADGAGSLVRKRLVGHRSGTDGPRPIRFFRAELPARGAATDAMLYDFTPMVDGLRGYLWVFPVPGDRINVGLMHSPQVSRTGAELATLCRARLLDHGIQLGAAPLRGWPAWGYHPASPVAGPRLCTVGDAAGIDGLTGEGIAVALEHGVLAGAAIANALATGDFSFSGYRKALRRATVGRELALDRWLAKLLYGPGYRRWLSLVLCDPEVLDLYAARVSGTLVLADRKLTLVAALLRHLAASSSRQRSLRDSARPLSLPSGCGRIPCTNSGCCPSARR
ncbi:MAG: NAD(P)/FAD-dependent oxidoreductase [Myxococcales bacterium]|nr:NAD(P)/FAD-dependent oxidoreductase [Myxococcales bacterium]